jgi:glycosyltransferase involved in cell wall biosynthesis
MELIDGESGLLFPPADAAALRSAMARLLSDHRLASSLVEHGKAAANRFTVQRHVSAIERVYRRVMAS